MRLTSSRAYTRPSPVPNMPPGLVELMEGLARDVLKSNPTNLYEFCANHMEKLLEIRDGPSSRKTPLTLEQKILIAQEKVRQRAKERQERYDRELQSQSPENALSNNKADSPSIQTESALPSLRAPVHHISNLENASEVEISHTSHADKIPLSESPDALTNEELNLLDTKEDLNDVTFENIERLKENENLEFELISAKTFEAEQIFGKIEGGTQNPQILEESNIIKMIGQEEVLESHLQTISEVSDENPASESIMILPEITINDANNEPVNKPEQPLQDTHSDVISESDNKNQAQTSESDKTEPLKSDDLVKDDKSNSFDSDTTKNNQISIENHNKPDGDLIVSDSRRNSENVAGDDENNLQLTESKQQHISESIQDLQSSNAINVVSDKVRDNNANEIAAVSENAVNTADDPNLTTPSADIPKVEDMCDDLNDEKLVKNSATDDDIQHKQITVTTDIPKVENMRDDLNNEMPVRATATDDDVRDKQITVNADIPTADMSDDSKNEMPVRASASDDDVQDKLINVTINEDSPTIINIVKADSVFAAEVNKDNEEDNKDDSFEIKSDLQITLESESTKIELGEQREHLQPSPGNIDSDNEKSHDHTTDISLIKTDSIENTNEDSSIVESDLSKNEDDPTQNNMDLETAAVTIQKVFRSFMFKSSNSEDPTNDEHNSLDEDSDKKEEYYAAAANLSKERRPLGITRMDTVLQTVNEEKSLSLSTDDSSTLSSAATTIQAHVRGFLVRNRLNSSKTYSMNSLVNSHEVLETDPDQQKSKTVLNIHIVPEEGNYLSRDESLITSMDLSLDISPPSSVNLHPLSCDISERRKMLKREDAVQSVSPPSNNSGKLSEDSVKEVLINENGVLERDPTDEKINEIEDQSYLDNEASDVISSASTVTPTTVITLSKSEEPLKSPREYTEVILQPNGRSFNKMSSDESDVITPYVPSPRSESATQLVHSGEFHDVVLPTKVSRNDTTVVREFKNVLVYFLLWNNS